jgi:hypothetical protein
MVSACKKDDTSAQQGPDDQQLISQIFQAGMSSYSTSMPGKSAPADFKSSIPVNLPVENTIYGPDGGSINVTGDITGSFNFDDQTAQFLGGSLLLGITETITDYGIMVNDVKYIMNGAPDVTLAGTFTIQPDYSFGTGSSYVIGGGVRVTGPNYDHTSNIQVTIVLNPTGTGGHVTGQIDGHSVDFTF